MFLEPKKITAFAMAIVVLFSTMSFTIDKHYCGKLLVDVAINHQAEKCGMERFLEKQEGEYQKPSCCKNEHTVVKGQDQLKKEVQTPIDFPIVQVQNKTASLDVQFILSSTTPIILGNHDPPDRQINFQTLYETYLI